MSSSSRPFSKLKRWIVNRVHAFLQTPFSVLGRWTFYYGERISFLYLLTSGFWTLSRSVLLALAALVIGRFPNESFVMTDFSLGQSPYALLVVSGILVTVGVYRGIKLPLLNAPYVYRAWAGLFLLGFSHHAVPVILGWFITVGSLGNMIDPSVEQSESPPADHSS